MPTQLLGVAAMLGNDAGVPLLEVNEKLGLGLLLEAALRYTAPQSYEGALMELPLAGLGRESVATLTLRRSTARLESAYATLY
jgi:hypothetical protein